MVLVLPNLDDENGNKDHEQYLFEAKENWGRFLEDQMPKQGGATTLFALPTEFIWLMKARTPVGVSWGVQKGSMAMIRAAQLADVACVLPAVPINNVRPAEAEDYVGASGPAIKHGFDAFLTTEITKNWVTVLAKKHKQGKSANLAAMMDALDRINAAAASHPLPGCPLCFSWKLALARGRMQAVVKQVRREDADVFQPLHLALSLHAGRRRGCPGTHWFTDALPEFYFLSINKYDNESGQIFVPKDPGTKRGAKAPDAQKMDRGGKKKKVAVTEEAFVTNAAHTVADNFGPIQRYTDLVQRGQLRYDGAQVLVLEHLSKLQRVLLKEHKAREKDAALQERYALERDEADDDAEAPPAPRRLRTRGARLREFMLEIHERIHAAREAATLEYATP
ncbi:ATP binding protein [Aureococcus anophagefferens]|nr:ATP binding protein [Aureococcus anophagefferens]